MEPRDSPHPMPMPTEFQMQALYDHIRAGAGALPLHHQPPPLQQQQQLSPHRHPHQYHFQYPQQQPLHHHLHHLHRLHHPHHQQQQQQQQQQHPEQQLPECTSRTAFSPSIIHSPAPLRQQTNPNPNPNHNPNPSFSPAPGPNLNPIANPALNMNHSSNSGMSACYPPETPPHMMPSQGPAGSPSSGMNMSASPGSAMVPVPAPAFKKKRGRPRKYTTDVNGSAALVAPLNSAEKKGGALGPSKKKKSSSLGATGQGFTPHVLTVGAGEDVTAKIMTFSQHGPWAVCILSANGAISNASLSHAGISSGPVTYEGRFEILSLSGLFLLTEDGPMRSRSGGFSVSLAGQDGRVIGGRVTGLLIAATTIQVVVGTFFPERRKVHQPKGGRLEGLSSLATTEGMREPHMQMMDNVHADAIEPVQDYVPEPSEVVLKEEEHGATNAMSLEPGEWGTSEYNEEPQ